MTTCSSKINAHVRDTLIETNLNQLLVQQFTPHFFCLLHPVQCFLQLQCKVTIAFHTQFFSSYLRKRKKSLIFTFASWTNSLQDADVNVKLFFYPLLHRRLVCHRALQELVIFLLTQIPFLRWTCQSQRRK